MAESNPPAADVPAPSAPGPARRSLVRRLVPVAFVVVVVAVECIVAYSYLPTASQTEAMAHAVVSDASPAKPTVDEKSAHPAEKEKTEKDAKPSPTDLVEVDLGQFTVTSVQPGSTTTLRIAFHLYGTVAALDHEKFNARLKETQHRFREQVILAIRGAEMNDLTEAGLGLLKRTILEKTNATLGESLLKAIVVSEFSFMEV